MAFFLLTYLGIIPTFNVLEWGRRDAGGCECLELPWEGIPNTSVLLCSREMGCRGNTSLPPRCPSGIAQRTAGGPWRSPPGPSQPFVRGGRSALVFRLVFDLGVDEEPQFPDYQPGQRAEQR